MIIFVTGISESGRRQYIDNVIRFSKSKNKNVKLFNVGQMILNQAINMDMNITTKNILNTSPYALKALRSAVFEKIIAEAPKHPVTIVETHGTFFWNKIYSNAYDWEYLMKLKPDMFITVIGNAPEIKKRHEKNEQWKEQKLTMDDLLLWQNIEVNTMKGWSDLFNKPKYVISEREPPSALYKLIFHPEMEPVYASFPMTHIKNPVQKKKIIDFVKKLNEYFVVFDPATIEIGPTATEVDDAQCINRDLYWLVDQTKKTIAYFPEIVLSTGVINELREAFETNKDVLLVFPKKSMSPFTSYYSHHTFLNLDELFKHLEKQGYKKVKDAN